MGFLTFFLAYRFASFSLSPRLDEDLKCKINQVTLEGCRKDGRICKIRRNTEGKLDVDFVPDFEGNDLTMMAYAMLANSEVGFHDMDPDACKFMTCPVVKDTPLQYSFGMRTASSYPLVSESITI